MQTGRGDIYHLHFVGITQDLSGILHHVSENTTISLTRNDELLR
jgi:hypothetical protein